MLRSWLIHRMLEEALDRMFTSINHHFLSVTHQFKIGNRYSKIVFSISTNATATCYEVLVKAIPRDDLSDMFGGFLHVSAKQIILDQDGKPPRSIGETNEPLSTFINPNSIIEVVN